MTRIGKIARLPHAVRHKLNQRLHDGEPNKGLVTWLNSLPEVVTILQAEFGGRLVTEQNMSEWKQGGYEDWLKHEESCALVTQLATRAADLEELSDGVGISDQFATVLAVELVRVIEALLAEATDPKERWPRLKEALDQLDQLRREDHRAAALRMEQERWQRECREVDEKTRKREIAEAKERVLAPIWAKLRRGTLAEIFGGGENGGKIADFVHAIQNDWPVSVADTPPAPSLPSQSNQIQLNPIKSI